MILTKSPGKNLRMLSDLMIVTLLYFFIICYLSNSHSSVIIYLLLSYFILFALPVACIHVNYLFQSCYIEIEINQSVIKLKIINDSKTIREDEIKIINYYMSASKLKKSALRNFPFEDYYYAEIILKNDERIFITCLYSNKINEILKQHLINTIHNDVQTFFPLIIKK